MRRRQLLAAAATTAVAGCGGKRSAAWTVEDVDWGYGGADEWLLSQLSATSDSLFLTARHVGTAPGSVLARVTR